MIFLFFFVITVCISFIHAHQDHSSHFQQQSKSWKYYPFNTAMKLHLTQNIDEIFLTTERMIEIPGNILYDFFRTLYEKNQPSAQLWSETSKIPKIIHQIWIGSPVPEELQAFLESWRSIHPDWEYKLWTDADLANFNLENRDLYDLAENFGVKSDIWRYEILYRYGGVYVDTDFEAIQVLEFLHHLYDFYTGLQTLDTQLVQLGLALIGSRPGHPLLKACIEELRKSFSRPGVTQKAGPMHFTRVFYKYAGRYEGLTDIAFPAFYFYPLGCREDVTDHDEAIKKWKSWGAYAIHWWSKTWLPAQYRRRQFATIKNDHAIIDWNR